jgi:hypothetical protein
MMSASFIEKCSLANNQHFGNNYVLPKLVSATFILFIRDKSGPSRVVPNFSLFSLALYDNSQVYW